MKFLCDHHRSILMACTKQAKTSWHKTLQLAQFYAVNDDLGRAVLYGGNALEIAEIVLSNQPVYENASRYVETAVEFAGALVRYDSSCNLLAVYNEVYFRLMSVSAVNNVEAAMQPLKDILLRSTTNQPLS
ncbi:hypothetical protein [Reinekea marinisedimentorum]|uniref:Uncharacterized protein n=1 Tax=Reinekea marinisedimentorum TaxID=230495 RepID=A0A4V2UIL3_9GAMM|nr:hypothetical protein [Reinekea marinisedimentorum]TCS36400.1 hypothetical protein BCF53_12522 [Reinekea marinisedimentorum]